MAHISPPNSDRVNSNQTSVSPAEAPFLTQRVRKRRAEIDDTAPPPLSISTAFPLKVVYAHDANWLGAGAAAAENDDDEDGRGTSTIHDNRTELLEVAKLVYAVGNEIWDEDISSLLEHIPGRTWLYKLERKWLQQTQYKWQSQILNEYILNKAKEMVLENPALENMTKAERRLLIVAEWNKHPKAMASAMLKPMSDVDKANMLAVRKFLMIKFVWAMNNTIELRINRPDDAESRKAVYEGWRALKSNPMFRAIMPDIKDMPVPYGGTFAKRHKMSSAVKDVPLPYGATSGRRRLPASAEDVDDVDDNDVDFEVLTEAERQEAERQGAQSGA